MCVEFFVTKKNELLVNEIAPRVHNSGHLTMNASNEILSSSILKSYFPSFCIAEIISSGFTIQSPNALAYKTLITQEMLAKGYLAGNSVYVCTEHTPEVVSEFFDALDPIFSLIKECEEGRDIMSLLKGPVCHSGFKRLN